MQSDWLSAILSSISKRVNHQSFNAWFRPISLASKDDSTLFLKVPDESYKEWIVGNYADVIEESLQELNLDGYKISFVFDDKHDTNRYEKGKKQNGGAKTIHQVSTDSQEALPFGLSRWYP